MMLTVFAVGSDYLVSCNKTLGKNTLLDTR